LCLGSNYCPQPLLVAEENSIVKKITTILLISPPGINPWSSHIITSTSSSSTKYETNNL
jgi:hypothetical protein